MRLQNVGADTPRNWNPAFRVPHQQKGGGGGGKLGRKNTNVVSYFPTLKGEPRMERLRAYRHKDMAMLLDADFRVTGWTVETSPVVLGTGKRAQEFTPDFRVHEGDRAYSVRVTLPGAKPSEARREQHAAADRAYRQHWPPTRASPSRRSCSGTAAATARPSCRRCWRTRGGRTARPRSAPSTRRSAAASIDGAAALPSGAGLRPRPARPRPERFDPSPCLPGRGVSVMMNFLPARNEGVRWNGAVWRVEALDANKVTLEHAQSGERQNLTIAEWFEGVRSGLIERRVRPLPVGSDRPRKHAYMRWNGVTWEVTVIRSGIINLRNVETNESGGISVARWKSGCLDGSVEMLASPAAQVPARVAPLLKVPVTSLPQNMQDAGKQISVYVEAWRDPRAFYDKHLPNVPADHRHLPRTLNKKKVVPFFDVVAEATKTPRPGFTTFCGWLRKIEEAGGDLRGALPRHDLQGPRARFMGAKVETWLNQAIDEAWLSQRRNKKKKVWDALVEKVAEWNEAHPRFPLRCPSQAHVALYIRDEVDRYVVARRRGTKEEADRAFKQVGPGVRTTCILERVEVDHSLVQIKVKDDLKRVVLGYPWLTVAIDHYSRAVLALHLNFESQSIGANLQALRMVMTPKHWLRQVVPELDYDYPWGKPTGFFFDRGADYDNDSLRMIGLSLDVAIDYAVGQQPEMKGVIERFWRYVKEEVVYGLDGAKLPGQTEVFGVDPDGEVWMTYSELARRFWFWVSTVYMKSPHRGLGGDFPLRKWQESEAAMGLPPRPRKTDDLNVLLTRTVDCVVSVQGVNWAGLNWYGKPLEAIMRHPRFREGMTVKVRLNEYDLSQAWVVNPFTCKDEKLTPRLPDYMAGLTPHAHDLILKSVPKKQQGTLGERELSRNRARLFEQEKARAARALKSKGGSVGSGHAKLNGIGQEAPHGDELGSVLPAPGGNPLADAAPVPDVGDAPDQAPGNGPATAEAPPPRRRRTQAPVPQRFRNRD